MKHRIRVAGILHEAGRLLLVEQISPHTGLSRWSPPGGGLELTDVDLYAGVVREVWEETGLPVRAGALRFLSEFYHSPTDTLMLEVWIDCFPDDGPQFGTPHLLNVQPGDGIAALRWWSKAEMQGMRINRPLDAPGFWDGLGRPVETVRHLGRWEE